jgi:hypothetical protein
MTTPNEQTVQEYAEEVANELINEFGEHNFPAFLERVNQILKQYNK